MSKGVQSVERAAAILRLLAVETEPVALAQLAGSLGLAKATAHGLLSTLKDVGFVEQDRGSGHYRVGRELFQLGSEPIDVNELRSRALNWTDALAARTGESAHLAVFRGQHAVVAHHVFRSDESRQSLETGNAIPLHAGALGKVLLAFDPGAARRVLDRPLEHHSFRTITDRAELVRELADVRARGWASGVEEVEVGVASLAAPVRDRGGYVIASVGIRGPVHTVCDGRLRPRDALVEEVLRAARSISREFGYGRPQ